VSIASLNVRILGLNGSSIVCIFVGILVVVYCSFEVPILSLYIRVLNLNGFFVVGIIVGLMVVVN
jgi:hypothetical protein